MGFVAYGAIPEVPVAVAAGMHLEIVPLPEAESCTPAEQAFLSCTENGGLLTYFVSPVSFVECLLGGSSYRSPNINNARYIDNPTTVNQLLENIV